jgi:hypothetical protein
MLQYDITRTWLTLDIGNRWNMYEISMFLRNMGWLPPGLTALNPRCQNSLYIQTAYIIIPPKQNLDCQFLRTWKQQQRSVTVHFSISDTEERETKSRIGQDGRSLEQDSSKDLQCMKVEWEHYTSLFGPVSMYYAGGDRQHYTETSTAILLSLHSCTHSDKTGHSDFLTNYVVSLV